MEVSKLIQNMREQGIGIWTEGGKIRYLKKDGKLDDDIKNILIYNKKEIISYFEEERERFDKFPLTDIQMAYLLGRKNSFENGDVASHLYLELDYPALDSVKVQKIWNQLIDKHDMLRAIVLEDGTQEVLRDVAEYPIYISTKCEEIRSKWSDKYYNTETWPMFDIGVTEDKEKTTLHLSFDFLIADWASIWTLLIEFETIYYNKGNGDEKCAISFRNYLKKISESVEFWNQQANVELPEKQMDQRKNVNSTFKEIKMDTLQNLFLKSALEMPKKTAVVDECGEHTYEELLWTAYGIADELQKCSCKAGDYVGIKLNKSFFQIASVLGTLLIGAAFVPIDNDQPEIRADKILEIAKIKCLIGEKEETHKYREKYKWIDKDSVILKKSYDEIVNDNFDDVAYVIFTSGSTGEPKGVVIEQQAVVNTIIDINERFQVKDKDSILALSQLHFDLSVYDIFGMLATGGTIVIPEKVRYKDPSYWLMLVEKWNITVWNSVPAFMEMFVDYLERFYKGEKLSINKILLSGDWIPVKLPEKICRFLKDVRIYSLGGATEASIWSIYHECKMGESYNSSIPYGVPLSNQGFEVLDANMKPCPDMVQGELYITGKGLAKEYLGDVSKTQSSFFWLNNKRIYKTGDFGRYLRNGEIEFLGRKDSQIKISGHRIDTGEIENAIMDCCSGKNCCVTTVDWNNEPKLVAVIVPKEDEKKDEKSVREALKRYLPQYMIPFFLQFIDEIPCTSNGKVDRQAIRKLFIDKRDDKIQHKRWELENLIDKEIYSILISVLKVDALYPDDNLFELGADSLLMAQIAGRVKEIIEQTKTSVTFDEILRQILNNPTGEAITTFVKSKQNILTSENVRTDDFRIIEKTAKDTVYIFFHTALGTTNCYRFVEKELRKEDLGDFLFINVEDVEWYYSIQYHELVDRITDEYVRKIEQLHYKNINLIGYYL